jgi:antitoxin PrlF
MSGSKLTSKFQATIPKDVRKKLKLKAGDTIIFDSVRGDIIIKKGTPLDKEYLRALTDTLSEWNSEEDEKNYEHLQDL